MCVYVCVRVKNTQGMYLILYNNMLTVKMSSKWGDVKKWIVYFLEI